MCQRDVPCGRGVTFYVHVTRRALVGSSHASSGVSVPARGNERASDSAEASIISAGWMRERCWNIKKLLSGDAVGVRNVEWKDPVVDEGPWKGLKIASVVRVLNEWDRSLSSKHNLFFLSLKQCYSGAETIKEAPSCPYLSFRCLSRNFWRKLQVKLWQIFQKLSY